MRLHGHSLYDFNAKRFHLLMLCQLSGAFPESLLFFQCLLPSTLSVSLIAISGGHFSLSKFNPQHLHQPSSQAGPHPWNLECWVIPRNPNSTFFPWASKVRKYVTISNCVLCDISMVLPDSQTSGSLTTPFNPWNSPKEYSTLEHFILFPSCLFGMFL